MKKLYHFSRNTSICRILMSLHQWILICLSISVYDEHKFTTPVKILTFINFLITFQLLLPFYFPLRFLKHKIKYVVFIGFHYNYFYFCNFINTFPFQYEYTIKLGNNPGASVYIWEAIFQNRPLNISSLRINRIFY